MLIHDSLIDLVGGTPLVRLCRLAAGLSATVLVKPEYLNPGGSVKDRAATAMVLAAERDGSLRPGGTIVEASSGNTGIGLAQAAAVRGFRIVVVLPETVAVEKMDVLRAYGAEVVTTPSSLPREHPEHVNRLAQRIAQETPGGWFADQYDNPANPAVHRATTGPEIWTATGGRVTHLVAGIGTGGTISGTGRYLKEQGPVEVVGADPATSVYHGGDGSPFFVEAAGHYRHTGTVTDVWPLSYHRDVVDRIEVIGDRESVLTTRRLAREEGMLVGASSGLAVAAALRVARGLGPEHVVVAVLPDSGRTYLSKYHSADWLRRLGFLDDDRPGLLADATGPVHVVTTATPLAEAAALAAGPARDQPLLPVVLHGRDPRFATAVSEILGALDPAVLARRDPATPVGEVMSGPPASVGTGDTAAEALARLDAAGADHAVLLRDGRLAGLVTRAELVARAG
ncbi:pyridoxal-phosphate dependent enzyme [Pseudonocardia sp. KRD-184]|uniref:Pyridoxal-phosphate dependent enzyme n=1 Tax=Pseudonocardia oceani TaxID=2792013 RepID=A0ABS6U9W4_9PSEU|nr:pyridoxal-phosphate dependent enzyme [Pseudonocardia oceani]MBW0089662.1 pyridoxal-phosphate dependent enzyme [Pseudonocardia oceani]MBW0094792.1 pyridoxal-phosphate dependent enzyme [Pseudonocardia oceani]MBW0123553.1 pyridoxal-phosphate dependent enzyme [Pseudonocardia oceani]MBW0129024.1 pyridoxal-phosphate dependent enzyme [Pseudonocardia oceani]